MKLLIQIGGILAAMILLNGCVASTNVSSYVDPLATERGPVGSIVVLGLGVPFDERRSLEESGVEALEARGVRGVVGASVIPPTRTMSDDEMIHALRETGAEAVLMVGAMDRGQSTTYVPQTYYPGVTTGTAYNYGNFTQFNVSQTPGYTTGGYSINKPVSSHDAVLVDMEGNTLWIAEGQSRGNAFADYADLGVSMVRQSIAKLAEDGVI